MNHGNVWLCPRKLHRRVPSLRSSQLSIRPPPQLSSPAPSSTIATIIPAKRLRTTWVLGSYTRSRPTNQVLQQEYRKAGIALSILSSSIRYNRGTRAIIDHVQTHDIKEHSARESRAINQQTSIKRSMDIAQELPHKRHRLNKSSGDSIDLG
jgi:hypothetical protein